MTGLTKLLALVCFSGFTAGLLVTSIVIVDSWSAMEPLAAIDWFADYGLTLGIVMAPLGGLAAVFSLIGLLLGIRNGDSSFQTGLWLLAMLAAVGTMVLLPIYFADANTRFFENTINATEVADEIENWAFWNWLRTALSILATGTMTLALASDGAKE